VSAALAIDQQMAMRWQYSAGPMRIPSVSIGLNAVTALAGPAESSGLV